MSEVLYEGKSKQVCKSDVEGCFIIKYKDTATAGNGKKKEELAGKGVLNSKISNIIYGYLEKNGIETHLVKEIDDTTALVKQVEVIMVEVIIRNIAAGGFSKKYGVEEGTKLNNTVVEYCFKSDAHDDPMMNKSQITAINLATRAELDQMEKDALQINDLLIKLFDGLGITLVDFKLEFGRTKDGKVILCDEISPDSCRFWDKETNKKLDKDVFRRDLGDVLAGYKDVLRRLEDNVK